MEYSYSVEEATQILYGRLAEATGWKLLKSQRCLKKTVKELVFEIDFFSSKWNLSHQSVEVNAEFRLWNKSYGKLPVNNVVASMPYNPDGGHWYDITTEEKLNQVLAELSKRINETAVNLCGRFEEDRRAAAEYLLECFDEYNVHLDFIADELGIDAIKDKARDICGALSDEEGQQIKDYKNGARNKTWMLNRCNLKYIVDNDLI